MVDLINSVQKNSLKSLAPWPAAVWSMLALEHYTPTLLTLPASLTSSHWLLEHASVNLATLTTMVYVVTYLLMDPIAGSKAILTSFNTVISS
jgi:hypothetical protein